MNRRLDFALSPLERADAREAFPLRFGTGMSLSEAIRRAVPGNGR